MTTPTNRTTLINYLIKTHHYISYLEIGVSNSYYNLAHIKCPIKIGIDPNCENVTFQLTSDEAFQYISPNTFDIIFIDGLHQEQQVDRDIENSLRVLKKDGIIVLHDCHPAKPIHALEINPGHGADWNGTVYKSMIKFHQLNPDCSFVINFDHGCGIIYPKLAKTPILFNNQPLDISWDTFDNNRTKLLNLKNINECVNLLDM